MVKLTLMQCRCWRNLAPVLKNEISISENLVIAFVGFILSSRQQMVKNLREYRTQILYLITLRLDRPLNTNAVTHL